MARTTRSRRPLAALLVILVAMLGALAAGTQWGKASFAPKLALDLAGGTQIILTPKLNPGESGEIDQTALNQAISIIRQRVDSSGVSEAEITSQSGQNIVVSLPGDPAEQEAAIKLVSQSAQMTFRPVLYVAAAQAAADPTATPDGAAPPEGQAPAEPAPAEPAPADSAPAEPAPADSAPAPSTGTNNRAVPRVAAAAAQPTAVPADSALVQQPGPAASDPGAPAAPADPNAADPNAADPNAADPNMADPNAVDPGAANTAATGTPSDQAQITEPDAMAFQALDCTKPENRTGGTAEDPTKVFVTCSQDGTARYILGPVEIQGANIRSASSGMGLNAQGSATGQFVVNMEFDGKGADAFEKVTTRLVGLQQPQNQFAIVLDGLVVSAPVAQVAITDGKAEISGSFTEDSAAQLANQLKFGALPMSFEVQSSEQISALLGSEQLRNGLLAGVIGLILVVIYSLLQYRALGLVTVASLLVTGFLTYLAIGLLSWAYGYRLSLPGVAGLIIAIGVTADSFIVYFERIRDEVREGRSLTAAVQTGWKRARRTIIASDAINLLAAVVLYLLAVGGVRGFAFTLGLTTILDLIVVILFTHPLVAILARTNFFGGGHKLSGFDAEHLGRAPAYAGRGRVRAGAGRAGTEAGVPADTRAESKGQGKSIGSADPSGFDDDSPFDRETGPMTIAERKAAQRKAAAAAVVNGGGGSTAVDTADVSLTKES